jgi:hypothetical protein
MLKNMHITVHLQHVLSWYTSLEALESLKIIYRRTLEVQAQVNLLGFIFYLEFRYAVLSRGMNHWLDNKHQKVLK